MTFVILGNMLFENCPSFEEEDFICCQMFRRVVKF
jgi:hypothetical protein